MDSTEDMKVISGRNDELPDTFVDDVVVQRILELQAELLPAHQNAGEALQIMPRQVISTLAPNSSEKLPYCAPKLAIPTMPARIEMTKTVAMIRSVIASKQTEAPEAVDTRLNSFLNNSNLIVFQGLPPSRGFFFSADGSGIDSGTGRQY